MTEVEGDDATKPRSGGMARACPKCGGGLSEPVSGQVHCFVYCLTCQSEFQLDDPRLERASG